jgi:hypothetical protein
MLSGLVAGSRFGSSVSMTDTELAVGSSGLGMLPEILLHVLTLNDIVQ